MTIKDYVRKRSLIGILIAGALGVSCTNQEKEYERSIEEFRKAFPSSVVFDPNKPRYLNIPREQLEKTELKDCATIYQTQKEETDGMYKRYIYGEIKTKERIIKLVEKEIVNK